MKQGHIEKANNNDENCFLSPAVITVKKDKSVKIALKSQKLNEYTIKRGTNTQHGVTNLHKLQENHGWSSRQNWTSKLDLDYVYGHLILFREVRNLCIFAVTGGDFTGYYRFLKRFYGLVEIPTTFQERTDHSLENKHPAWLDDMIIVS